MRTTPTAITKTVRLVALLTLPCGPATAGVVTDAPQALALNAPASSVPAGLPWDGAKQGKFVTALCADPQGRTIIATEGQGVWRYAPAAQHYDHFTTQDGLGSDDVYALAVDAKGRLWAGTLRGLSVYNGHAWKTYGPLEGVGGWRTFALAVCPADGDIWAATEGGLTRYSLHQGTWTQYSRLDGLSSDALSCLAFTQSGDLYVGTQADGVAKASRADGYRIWRVTRGPAQMPSTNAGPGLPTSLINCLFVVYDGTVYAGTDTGLALSDDGGDHWRFLRGKDWEDMVKGLPHGPVPVKKDMHGLSLLEDYVTCLAGDGQGHLLVGHRQRGMEVFNLPTKKRVYQTPKRKSAKGQSSKGQSSKDKAPVDYVTSLLPRPDGTCLVGGYGTGLTGTRLPGVPANTSPPAVASVPEAVPPLPVPASPPTLAKLNDMLRLVSAVPPDPQEMQPKVVALDDDWRTEGDWLGRYGRYWVCLCATCSPDDYKWGAGWEPVHYASRQGLAPVPGDALRYWVQWLYTDDPRVLEMPPTYLDSQIKLHLTDGSGPRREAEQDDHGEAYSMSAGGLGVYETVTVPPGLYMLSLYDTNYNGHSGAQRFRDYRLSVRPQWGNGLGDGVDSDQAPEGAHGRVVDFWSGVWKRFLVRGPVDVTVAVDRNHSFNTILPAVTLDLADEEPPPYFGTVVQWEADQRQQARERQALVMAWRASGGPGTFQPAATAAEAAGQLLAALSRARLVNSSWWAVNGRRFYRPLLLWFALQPAATDAAGPSRRLAAEGTCAYALELYPDWEQCQRARGLKTARDVEKALKWDGGNDTGQGYQIVTSYLARHVQVIPK